MDNRYYVSIMQVREAPESIIIFVEEKIIDAKQKGIFLSKKKKVPNGFDYYLSSNKFAISLGRELYRKFGGELKINEKLFTKDRQSSKDLYRVNVFYRPSGLQKGDVMLFEERPILVSNTNKKITGIDLQTGERVYLDPKKVHEDTLEIQNSIVTKVFPVPEIMDPDNYQNIILERAPENLKSGQKIKTVIHGGKAYFIK